MTEEFVRNDDMLLDLAEQRMSEGNITGAVSVYRSLLGENPFGYDQNAGIAEAFTEAGLFSHAVNAWFRALSVAADDYQRARAFNGLGANYYFLNNNVISFHYFGAQVSIDAVSDFEYNDVIEDIRDASEEEYYKQPFYVAYDKDKKSSGRELIEKANGLVNNGAFTEALETLANVGEDDECYKEALGLIALVLLMSERYDDAVSMGEKLLAVDKSDFFANYVLAGCYYHSGQSEKSDECFKVAASSDSKKTENFELRMLLLSLDTNRIGDGLFYANKIIAEDPFDFDVLYVRGTLLFNSGDRQGCIDDYKKIITFTDNPAVKSRLEFVKKADGTAQSLPYETNLREAAMRYMLEFIKKGIPEPENVKFSEVKTHLEFVIRYGITEFVSSVLQLALAIDAKAAHAFLKEIFLDVTVTDEIKSEIIRVYLMLGINIPVACVSANLYKEFTIRPYAFTGYAATLFGVVYSLAAAMIYLIDHTKIPLLRKRTAKAKEYYEQRGGNEKSVEYAALAAAIIHSMKLKVISDKKLLKDMFSIKTEAFDDAILSISPCCDNDGEIQKG
ncbi:MAG: hypothetical protein MRZ91_06400 [Christensenellaceae bacterium]|nr:hypothetical protein [Christensenellaceae bacterium]MDY2851510.1 hypothetical protein [Christensenellaceae bacterium]